jgi:hypothetical protein
MPVYTILGVEHVYDAFDEYEHTNPLPAIQVKAGSDNEAYKMGTHALSSLVTDTRREGGFLSSGTFVSQIVEVRDSASAVIHKEDVVAPWGTNEALMSSGGIWAFTSAAQLDAEEETRSFGPEKGFEEDYSAILRPQDLSSQLIVRYWGAELIQHLAANPMEIYSLTPRRFEELVADLLAALYPKAVITLSPLGKDGGVDVALERRTELGLEQLLVQCKRFHSKHKSGHRDCEATPCRCERQECHAGACRNQFLFHQAGA